MIAAFTCLVLVLIPQQAPPQSHATDVASGEQEEARQDEADGSLAAEAAQAARAAARERQRRERAELDRVEGVASSIGSILSKLDRAFASGEDPLPPETVGALLSPDARAARPTERGEPTASWRAGTAAAPVLVERFDEGELDVDGTTGPEDAVDDFRAAFAALEAALGGRPTRPGEVKIKEVLPVEGDATTFTIRVRARHVRETKGSEAVAVHSVWKMLWSLEEEGAAPRLLAWAPFVVQRLRFDGDKSSRGFVDVAGAVLTGERASRLDPSILELREVLDAGLDVGILGHHGVVVADVNGDGIDDLYLCQPGGVPNQLWVRRADGTAEEVAGAGGLDIVDATTSALFVDLDGDGDRDVVLGLGGGVRIFTRTATGYVRSAEFERTGVTSLAAADVDRDGRIDLYICAYANPYNGTTFPVPYHEAENGQPNLFLSNRTEGADALRFVDSTQAAGLGVGAARFSFAATFEDYDDDGDIDLYVANDFGRNALYTNTGSGRFVERAAELGAQDIAAGMSAAFADIDRDGRVDLYVSNMESSAGRRITGQEVFHATTDEAERGLLRRHAKGNTLYLGQADGTFRESCLATQGQWAWGAIPIDLDGNGFLDLFVPNGFVTGSDGERPDL